MSNSEFLFYRREWLNSPGEGNAFVEAEIRKPTREDRHAYYEGGDLTIKDCSRQVTLSFPIYSEKDRSNSLLKISQLLNVIEGFQAILLHSANKAEAVELRHKEAKEKKAAQAKEGESDECDCDNCKEPE